MGNPIVPVTQFNDCAGSRIDRAALFGRAARVFSSLGIMPVIGIETVDSTTELAAMLFNQLSVYAGSPAVIFGNIAKREETPGSNGEDFAVFRHGQTIVHTTFAHDTLSVLDQFGLVGNLYVLNVEQMIQWNQRMGTLDLLSETPEYHGKASWRSKVLALPTGASIFLSPLDFFGTYRPSPKKFLIPTVKPGLVIAIDHFGNLVLGDKWEVVKGYREWFGLPVVEHIAQIENGETAVSHLSYGHELGESHLLAAVFTKGGRADRGGEIMIGHQL